MSHRSKSGQKQTRHKHNMRKLRRWKRKRAALMAAGHMKKGTAPVATASQS
jgi:hypothetical protein